MTKQKSMTEVRLTPEQDAQATSLGEGKIVFACLDGTAVRMETEGGESPYVWRDGNWRVMRQLS